MLTKEKNKENVRSCIKIGLFLRSSWRVFSKVMSSFLHFNTEGRVWGPPSWFSLANIGMFSAHQSTLLLCQNCFNLDLAWLCTAIVSLHRLCSGASFIIAQGGTTFAIWETITVYSWEHCWRLHLVLLRLEFSVSLFRKRKEHVSWFIFLQNNSRALILKV